MTIEEAIKHIEIAVEYSKNILEKFPRDSGRLFTIEAMNMAIEALKFQKELVKCKDCELRYPHPQNDFCNRHMGKVHDDGFCFEGERRDAE